VTFALRKVRQLHLTGEWGKIYYPAKEVMFSPLSVCLSVSTITEKAIGHIITKFSGMVGHTPGN